MSTSKISLYAMGGRGRGGTRGDVEARFITGQAGNIWRVCDIVP